MFCGVFCVIWTVSCIVFFFEMWTDHNEVPWYCRDDFWWFMWCFVTRVPHQVRRSRFLLRPCEAGPALQPMEGEHVYLSSRRIIDL